MKLVVSGMGGRAAGNHLRALMRQSQAPRDERWQNRFDFIPRAVASARKKLADKAAEAAQLAAEAAAQAQGGVSAGGNGAAQSPAPQSGAGGAGTAPPPPPSWLSAGIPPGPGPQPQPAPPAQLPIIQLVEGELPRVIDEAEAALLADIARQQLYQRGELVVRPVRLKLRAADMQGHRRETSGWQLLQVTKPYMIETFTRVARFERWNERAKDWLAKNCPGWVAETYLARAGRWKVPVLLRIVNVPFLRSDGSLCERPGYDPDSALLYILGRGQSFPSIPVAPTLQQAREALAYLDETLFEEFPFVEKVDRSVALSLVLTALDRHAMATAPLHAFTSPVAGTGKSLLVDIASLLASGELTPVISQGSNKDETEKRLGAELLSGNAIVSFDNCSTEVDSELLCQALTQRELRIRELGYSRNVKVPITALFTVNGNNLVIANDLTRRTLLCQIDAGVERPETRKFKRKVAEVAREHRGKLVAAALTVLRGWHAAQTTIGVEPMGSFEEWSHRIRCPLLWLDRDDPCDSIKTIRANDPLRSLLNAVLMQWKVALGTVNSFTVQQVIDKAVELAAGQLGIAGRSPIPPAPDFYHALAVVAAAKNGNSISNERLGRWLSKNNGKIVNRLKLARTGMKDGYPLWQVLEI
jgi:putative DNA primase/helicase